MDVVIISETIDDGIILVGKHLMGAELMRKIEGTPARQQRSSHR